MYIDDHGVKAREIFASKDLEILMGLDQNKVIRPLFYYLLMGTGEKLCL
jgi:hypothetical protein